MRFTLGTSKLTDFLGALLGSFGWVIAVDTAVTALQRRGGAYGNMGIAAAICILVALTALAIALCFGSRWRCARAETAGVLLGLPAALALVLCVRYGN
ncbi:hypothetical protein [Lysobacter sp. Root983]|uniref:hypothetical protein n=1 Tax=Lysobacter sp. Root983 TaxID=1736613 RepID=UPI0012F84D18|nr:hypothetical protein [Lysobacter sp. Root983]